MLGRIAALTSKAGRSTFVCSVRRELSVAIPPETDEWLLYPREHEGNNYQVNWSLVGDGVTPVGNAYRNPRLPLVLTKMGVTGKSSVIEVSKPVFEGSGSVLEAGDSISHEAFEEAFQAQQQYLSSGIELFVEDAALSSFNQLRVGVRVVSDDPSWVLIARNMLIPLPPRGVDHRARFDGWNSDERWHQEVPTWIGDKYELIPVESGFKFGDRPVAAFIGGEGREVAVQYVQKDGVIVGANITAGTTAPVRTVLDALNQATLVLMNERYDSVLALPSTSIVLDKSTTVIVNAPDEVVAAAVSMKKGSLYGAYGNALSDLGVSALWNGYIGKAPPAAPAADGSAATVIPTVGAKDKVAVAAPPHNLAFPMSHLVFYESSGGKGGSVSEEVAVQRLLELTDPSKEELIKNMVKGLKISSIAKTSGLSALL